MIEVGNLRGVVYDVDDTLFDNQCIEGAHNIHEHTRFLAVGAAASHFGAPGLSEITREQNFAAFENATYHGLEGAVWSILEMADLVGPDDEYDPKNEVLQYIIDHKNKLHPAVMREHGREVPGATKFVRALDDHGVRSAIASTAPDREIQIVLELLGIQGIFPEERIFSKDNTANRKPHPEPFDRAFRSLDLAEEQRPEVLALEDDPRGVASAKSAGLYVVGITTRRTQEQLDEAGADLVVGTYDELADKIGLA